MVLEVDGVRVAGQPHPSTHRREGTEVKTALVYPRQAPRARARGGGDEARAAAPAPGAAAGGGGETG
jgi:hypothetical protein